MSMKIAKMNVSVATPISGLITKKSPKRMPSTDILGPKEALGEGGWLKALELEEYAAFSRNKPKTLQGALFSYLESPVARVARVRSPRPGFASAEGGTSSSKTR